MANVSSIALNKPITDLITSSTAPTSPPTSIPGAIWWLIPPVSSFTNALSAPGDIAPLNADQYVWVPLTSTDLRQNTTENQTTRLTFQPDRVLVLSTLNSSINTLPSVGNSIPSGWIYLVVPASSNVGLTVPSQFIFANRPTQAGIVGSSSLNGAPTQLFQATTPIVNPNTNVAQTSTSSNLEVVPNQVIWHIITPTANLAATTQSRNGQFVLRLSQLSNQSTNLTQGTWWTR